MKKIIFVFLIATILIFFFGCTNNTASPNQQNPPPATDQNKSPSATAPTPAGNGATNPSASPSSVPSPQNNPPPLNVDMAPPAPPPPLALVPDFKRTDKICVLPVIFIPYDSTLSDSEISSSKQLLNAHMKLAQALYQTLLNTTFCTKGNILVYKSANDNAYLTSQFDNDSGSSYKILAELLAKNNEDRYNSSTIYLVLYVRPKNPAGQKTFGGGRTMNGPPNSGGGYVEMEYTSLTEGKPYPFHSTVVHELGHAFGLVHSTCFGYDLSTGTSIMTYNLKHQTKGLTESAEPGDFYPEEYFELSLNKRAFPNFDYNNITYNPQNKFLDMDAIQGCFLGPMDNSIGEYKNLSGVGYELYFDSNRVNGAGSSFFSLKQAQENCKWNQENHAGTKVECRYNGQIFS